MKKIYFLIGLLFIGFTTIGQNVTVFPQGSSWKYLYDQFDLGATWRSSSFDDSLWNIGEGEFGYGDGDEGTIIENQTGAEKHRTTYFRKTFTVTNPSAYPWYLLSLLRDDGAVVYLNGVEVTRSNMSSADMQYSNVAVTEVKDGDEATFYGFMINAASFINGENLLAVEVHQALIDDPDLSFNAKLDAVPTPECIVPRIITSHATATTAVTLDWDTVSGAISYNIRYRPRATGIWTTIPAATNSLNLTELLPGISYEYRIQANCSSSSDYSELNYFTTPTTSCEIPTGVTVISNSASTVIINWDEVANATMYNIEYQLAGTNSWVTTTATTHTKTISDLIAATDYEFRVQAVCAFNSDYSAIVPFTTYALGNDTFISPSATWKYLDNGTNQGTAWRSNTFDDTLWSSGKAELGYGDGDETTVVNYGPDPELKYLTTYFRKTFTVINPAAYNELTLGVIFDDGVVVYLNGNEVYRSNMPAGTINYNTPAALGVSGEAERTWNTIALNSSLFLTGTNVLTAEVHQLSYDSSDLSFNARIVAPSLEATALVTRGAYLQKLNSNGVTIRWRTDIPDNSNVKYGTSVAFGNNVSNPTLTTEHEITLTGLAPGTKYYYTIGTTTQTLQGGLKNNFITAPITGSTSPVRIWAIGDFGNGTNNQLRVRDAYTNYTASTPTNLWLWLGDNAYTTGSDTEFQERNFNQYPEQFKSMPVFSTPGNHDYNESGYQQPATLTTNYPYFSIFSLPQNGECGGVPSGSPKYYSFDYANIHFISLDSYGTLNAPGSEMYTWLTNDLAANTQHWTVVFMHYPPYTYGTHNSDTETTLIDMRTIITPLLESYHVDVVLTGHSHVNERSYMIKGHYGIATTFTEAMKMSPQNNHFVKTPPYNGTVYAVCGTSGQNPAVVNQPGYPMPAMYFNNNTNNCSLVIDVNGDFFSCKYLTSTGVIADEFTITKN